MGGSSASSEPLTAGSSGYQSSHGERDVNGPYLGIPTNIGNYAVAMEFGIDPLNCAPLNSRVWETLVSNMREIVFHEDTVITLPNYPGIFIVF